MSNNPINDFFAGVRDQFHKVTWPDRATTINTTIVVIIATIVTAVYIGAVDYGLDYIIKEIII